MNRLLPRHRECSSLTIVAGESILNGVVGGAWGYFGYHIQGTRALRLGG